MLQTQEKLLPALDSGSHINARHKLRLEASAERTLEGGGSMPLLDAGKRSSSEPLPHHTPGLGTRLDMGAVQNHAAPSSSLRKPPAPLPTTSPSGP
jgi:hypothetical protein